MLLATLLQIISYLITVVIFLVIVQFVIGLLMSFNVISRSNEFVHGVYNSINSLLDPALRPIRKILPDTGMIDFSPMVLIIGLRILQIVLGNLYAATL